MTQRSLPYLLCCCLLALVASAQQPYVSEPLAHTYSIVAYDTTTGEMGVAVQSHWFSVGSLVIWGEAGVGVVATQSFVNPALGPQGLALMRTGIDAETALRSLLATDAGEAFRQVAFLDRMGRVAAHTGSKCIEAAGHQLGDGYSVQANMMEKATVWPSMARAFEASDGQPLAERLLAALEAAEAEGGDIRGRQSAALLVVAPEATRQPWVDRRVDLRIEDHAQPIVELRRLLRLKRAYDHMNAGDLAVEAGDVPAARREYGAAQTLVPDNLEMQYWHAVALANAGEIKLALPLFKQVFQGDDRWRSLTTRITKNGLLTVGENELKQILTQ